MMRTLMINGEARATAADGDTPLLHVLRNELGLVAARFGCGLEACGACTVLVDGTPAYACTLTVDALAGRAVTTLEGIGSRDHPHALQQAFLDTQAGQCGYCLSGIILSAKALLDRDPAPTRAAIADALDGHLCRCGAHHRILTAIERAAAALRDAGAAA